MGNKEKRPEAERYVNIRHRHSPNVTHPLELLLEVLDDLDIVVGQDGW